MSEPASQVTFYLLGKPIRGGRLHLACKLAETAYKRGHKVYIHTPNDGISRDLDRLLWTFSDGSFVPHAVTEANGMTQSDDYPVVIGSREPDETHQDVLIPLLNEVTPYFGRFARVMEAVDSEEADKQQARQRFKAYRDLGIEPQTHDL